MINLKKDLTDSEYGMFVDAVINGNEYAVLCHIHSEFIITDVLHHIAYCDSLSGNEKVEHLIFACNGLKNYSRLINLIDLKLMN